jgi:hypothetical protein
MEKPRKTFAEVAGRRTFRTLTASQQCTNYVYFSAIFLGKPLIHASQETNLANRTTKRT